MVKPELGRLLRNGKVPPLVLFYGEETFLLEGTLRAVIDHVVPADLRDFNLEVRSGRETTARAILESVDTLPVFNPQRLVVVKEIQNLPAAELDLLLPYLKHPAPETVLLLVGDKIDGRRKFFQEFKKAGLLLEFKRPAEAQIPSLVTNLAREAGRSLTEEALALFCRRIGNDVGEVHAELDKLFAYLGEGKTLADAADVAAVVCATRSESVFDLASAVGRRDLAGAMTLLHRLLADGTAPLLLLSLLERHFRQLWKTRHLLDLGTGRKEMAGPVGVNPYFIDGLIDQARRLKPACFPRAFELFLGTDLALKSSGAHPDALMEKLLLELAEALR